VAYGIFQSILPSAWFRLWSGPTGCHPVPVSLPVFSCHSPADGVTSLRIGAAILSHHVDDFALVSAFFLFSIGCLNILLGLIFKEKGKTKRSVTSWRDHAKSVLPPPVQRAASSASTLWGPTLSEKKNGSGKNLSERFAGYGFGRQGEKEAGKKGFLISKPVEALPRYVPRARASIPLSL
jgi:hypothetical protein